MRDGSAIEARDGYDLAHVDGSRKPRARLRLCRGGRGLVAQPRSAVVAAAPGAGDRPGPRWTVAEHVLAHVARVRFEQTSPSAAANRSSCGRSGFRVLGTVDAKAPHLDRGQQREAERVEHATGERA